EGIHREKLLQELEQRYQTDIENQDINSVFAAWEGIGFQKAIAENDLLVLQEECAHIGQQILSMETERIGSILVNLDQELRRLDQPLSTNALTPQKYTILFSLQTEAASTLVTKLQQYYQK